MDNFIEVKVEYNTFRGQYLVALKHLSPELLILFTCRTKEAAEDCVACINTQKYTSLEKLKEDWC